MQALYQPEGGILASEECIRAHVAAAQAAGAELHEEESVRSWAEDPGSGGVRVVTDRAEYTAGKLILAAGSWMGQLVPPLKVRQQYML